MGFNSAFKGLNEGIFQDTAKTHRTMDSSLPTLRK